ncbi:MAG: MFS transporter, partial [Clostridiales bacterium]|nr:MFS transporter [Clostridiales bacterium]
METTKLFQKDFTMVVIGQIISLFGNAMLRYALPLYLLNKTHSPALFGFVIAGSFIPMILLSPVGGIFADRVNKRNIMVFLDFTTAALILIFSLLLFKVDLVILILIMLMLLYGIQGAYQPTVQASLPVLVSQENLMPGNAVINLVGSLAGLIGPILGGILFGFWGIIPILYLSIICFSFSAIMEIFIKIPFEKTERKGGIMKLVYEDVQESLHFIKTKNPEIGKICILLAFINMVFSSLIIIGVPIIINEHLGFSQSVGNRLYGYAEGALAAGGLIGGILAGVIGKKIKFRQSYLSILCSAMTLLPIGMVLLLPVGSDIAYLVIVGCCLIMMMFSTIFSIQMLSYVQSVTPPHLIGKVMSFLMSLVMCSHP